MDFYQYLKKDFYVKIACTHLGKFSFNLKLNCNRFYKPSKGLIQLHRQLWLKQTKNDGGVWQRGIIQITLQWQHRVNVPPSWLTYQHDLRGIGEWSANDKETYIFLSEKELQKNKVLVGRMKTNRLFHFQRPWNLHLTKAAFLTYT